MSIEAIRWENIDGLILDAVGTIIEPEPSVAQAYAETADRQGIVLDPAEVKRRFGRFFRVDEIDERLGHLVTDEPTEADRWRRIVGNVLPELPDPDQAFAELWDHFGRASAWRTFDDVVASLSALRSAGIEFVIASNFDARLRNVARGLVELAGCADRLVISSEVGFRKPHPSFYRAARARLGLPSDRVLCVGDDEENDLRGPENAGLRGLLIDRDGRAAAGLPTLPSLETVTRFLVNARQSRSGIGRREGNSPIE